MKFYLSSLFGLIKLSINGAQYFRFHEALQEETVEIGIRFARIHTRYFLGNYVLLQSFC